MEKRLKHVLDVRDIPPSYHLCKPGKPLLKSLVGAGAPSPHESEVIEYLRGGVPCGLCPDGQILYDILRTDTRVRIDDVLAADGLQDVGASIVYTDGEWTWAGATIYYIKHYHLPIPDELVAFAKSNHWQIDKAKIDLSKLNLFSFFDE